MLARRRVPYSVYARRRLGNASNEWEGIRTMFRRSFTAPTLAGFWRQWNPVFSYYLYYGCYRPLSRFLPRALALLLTFMASGAVHDFFATLARWRLSLTFTLIFALFGLLVIGSEGLGIRFGWAPPWLRVLIHSVALLGPVLVGLWVRGQWL